MLAMILAWIAIILGATVVILGFVYIAEVGFIHLGGIAAIFVGLAISISSGFWLYGTDSGARALESGTSIFHPSTRSGATKVVTIYNMEGEKVAQYEGKLFDVNERRIIFDVSQPDGSYKRIQIWSTAGTVTIKEK